MPFMALEPDAEPIASTTQGSTTSLARERPARRASARLTRRHIGLHHHSSKQSCDALMNAALEPALPPERPTIAPSSAPLPDQLATGPLSAPGPAQGNREQPSSPSIVILSDDDDEAQPIQSAPAPSHPASVSYLAPRLQEALQQFLANSLQRTIDVPVSSRAEANDLCQRAQGLGLSAETFYTLTDGAHVLLCKPEGWALPAGLAAQQGASKAAVRDQQRARSPSPEIVILDEFTPSSAGPAQPATPAGAAGAPQAPILSPAAPSDRKPIPFPSQPPHHQPPQQTNLAGPTALQGVTRQAWCSFLERAGHPFLDPDDDHTHEDEAVFYIVSEPAHSVMDIPICSRAARFWLHTRAGSLGLKTDTLNRDRNDDATVRLTKPAGWAMPAAPLPVAAVPRGPQSAAQLASAPRRHGWSKKRSRGGGGYSRWDEMSECCECGAAMDPDEGEYDHMTGVGPLCYNCYHTHG